MSSLLGYYLVPAVDVAAFDTGLVTRTLQEVLEDCGSLVVWLEIEGIGELVDGTPTIYRFSSATPPWNENGYAWKPWVTDWPSQVEEIINPLGGVRSAGELAFNLLDGSEDDRYKLTALFRDDAAYSSRLATAMSASTLQLETETGLWSVGDLIYLRNEVLSIGGLDSTAGGIDTWVVERGVLGTRPQAHPIHTKLFPTNFFIQGRRVRFYYGATEAPNDYREIESAWVIDRLGMDNFTTWTLRAISRETFLDRLLMRVRQWIGTPRRSASYMYLTVNGLIASNTVLFDQQAGGNFATERVTWDELWPEQHRFFEVNHKEVILSHCRAATGSGTSPQLSEGGSRTEAARRGVAHTGNESTGAQPTLLTEVYVADADLRNRDGLQVGSFRYAHDSAGAVSEDRTDNNWIVDDNPVVITLCLMLSSATPEDALELVNHDGVWNFSGLPPGVGIGVPVAEVNIDSFISVWERLRYLRSPNTVVGLQKEDESFTEWFEREFGWTRILLRIVDGLWTASLATIELENAASASGGPSSVGAGTTTIDNTNILTIESDLAGLRQPLIEIGRFTEFAANSVAYKYRDRNGNEVTNTFTEDDFREVLGQSGTYGIDEKTITFEAPGLRIDDAQDTLMVMPFALSILLRVYRPIWKVIVKVPLSMDVQLTAGQVLNLTYALIPKDGARGWTNEQVVLHQKDTLISPDGTYISIVLIGFDLPGRYGRISASGRINTVTDVGGGSFGIAIDANRYTETAVADTTINKDISAFQLAWIVKVYTRDGVEIDPAFQTIVLLDEPTNTIVVDGDFATSLPTGVAEYPAGPAGLVIEFAEHADIVGTQLTNYVAIGDASGIGPGDATLWNMAEF